jgi:predicted permease
MTLLDYLPVRISMLFQRFRINAEFEEELHSHILHRADDLERSGLDRAQAERQARIEFGAREKFREECHDALGYGFFEILFLDLRFALRVLRKVPAITIAAVVTLTLAIGANATVFGILDALILRPLNVPQAEDLYGTQYGESSEFQSYPNYVDLRDHNHSFEDLAAYNFIFVGITTGKTPSVASGYQTTGNYFDVLRINPYLGRFFHSSDERGPNSAPFLVMNYAYWRSQFHGDPGIIGQVVQLDKHPFTVIGVAPKEFQGTLSFFTPDVFVPIVNQEQFGGDTALNARGNNHAIFEVFGHLKPGVTPADAAVDVNTFGATLEKTYPNEVSHKKASLSHEGLTSFGAPIKGFMTGLVSLAGLILLAACANLGGLFAANVSDRSRELALRLALGSSRRRILRQLLTEAMLISLAGGTLGLVGSFALLRWLSEWHPFPGAPIHLPVNPDARICLVSLAFSLASGFLFGVVPLNQVIRANPYEIVKAGSIRRLGYRITFRDILLLVQIAISAVLVNSSMVAVRGLVRSLHSNLGFEPRHTMLLRTDLSMAGYSGEDVPAMQKRMVDAMETIPGAERVGLVNNYPPLVYGAGERSKIFRDESSDLKPSSVAATPYRYEVSPGYFDASGTALLAGRSFSWRDDKKASLVAVVNRELAAKLSGSVVIAVGKYFRLHDGRRVQVVGVVEDGKYLTVNEDQQSAMFLSSLQSPLSATYLVMRSERDPQQLSEAMRTKLRQQDAALPCDIATWNTLLAAVLFPSRVATIALGIMGAIGALLSITGIFGMAAHSVSKRLRELGIRRALGAQRAEVLWSILGRPLKLLIAGSVAGISLGILGARLLAVLVYEPTPLDPWVVAGVVLAMAMLGLVATWIPAQRALTMDPLLLLREE